jgi:hypothetical protein
VVPNSSGLARFGQVPRFVKHHGGSVEVGGGRKLRVGITESSGGIENQDVDRTYRRWE